MASSLNPSGSRSATRCPRIRCARMIIIALMLSSTALSTASSLKVKFAAFAFAFIAAFARIAISESSPHSLVRAPVNSSFGCWGQSCLVQLGFWELFPLSAASVSRDWKNACHAESTEFGFCLKFCCKLSKYSAFWPCMNEDP